MLGVALNLDSPASGSMDCHLWHRTREVNFRIASAPPQKSYWLTNRSAELRSGSSRSGKTPISKMVFPTKGFNPGRDWTHKGGCGGRHGRLTGFLGAYARTTDEVYIREGWLDAEFLSPILRSTLADGFSTTSKRQSMFAM